MPVPRSRWLSVVAVASWLVAIAGVVVYATVRESTYKDMSVELPYATEWLLTGCHALRAAWGLVPLGAGIALMLLPMRTLPHARATTWWSGLGIVQAAVFALFAVGVLELPLGHVCSSLSGPADAPRVGHPVVGDHFPFVLFAFLGVACAQLACWALVAQRVSRLPRGTGREEVERLIVTGVIPAVLAGLAAGGVAAAVGVPTFSWMLLPTEASVGVTAAVIAMGVAGWSRLRVREGGGELQGVG